MAGYGISTADRTGGRNHRYGAGSSLSTYNTSYSSVNPDDQDIFNRDRNSGPLTPADIRDWQRRRQQLGLSDSNEEWYAGTLVLRPFSASDVNQDPNRSPYEAGGRIFSSPRAGSFGHGRTGGAGSRDGDVSGHSLWESGERDRGAIRSQLAHIESLSPAEKDQLAQALSRISSGDPQAMASVIRIAEAGYMAFSDLMELTEMLTIQQEGASAGIRVIAGSSGGQYRLEMSNGRSVDVNQQTYRYLLSTGMLAQGQIPGQNASLTGGGP
ncbi:MAG: hypothetical protein SFZ03_07030 [Candidatus Melainabacteria bacterium]|nr:hypothetical protein [Candidatus Melainabacteria bacterium]